MAYSRAADGPRPSELPTSPRTFDITNAEARRFLTRAPPSKVLAEGPSSSVVFTFFGASLDEDALLAGIESYILCEFSAEEDDQPQRPFP